MDQSSQQGAIQRVITTFKDLNLTSQLIAIVLLLGLVRRVISNPKKAGVFPVWAILEVAFTSYILSGDGLARRIYSLIRRYGGSLFGLTSSHQVLANLPNVDRLMAQPNHVMNNDSVQYSLYVRVFGAIDSPQLKKKFEVSCKGLLVPVERLFVNESAVVTAIERGDSAQKGASFVTFSNDPKHMMRWELSANIKVVTPDLPGQLGAVEADFQSLVRDFGACFAIPLLYGQDFLDRTPNLLDDFWKFDNDMFPLLMIGIPEWAPFKAMKEGRAARARLLDNIEALYRRINKSQNGQQVDADMSDVSTVALGRNKVYNEMDWTFKERGTGDLAIFWGQNANTQPLLFWLLTYIYSTPDLVPSLRSELAPYIKLSKTNPLSITSVDLPAIFRNCQLLKSCIFETFRLTNEATSIRYVETPLTIPDGTYTHTIKPNTFISAPHAITQRDPSIYANPNKFIPDRFLETDSESSKPTARYGKLRPWGSGHSICKGRTFAEKEIMALGAIVIALWDVEPVGGIWKFPNMVPGTGVKKPVKDIRVVIRRRIVQC